MANNYRQFSFALKLNNKKEAVWCQKRLKKLSETEGEDGYGSMTDFEWTVYGHLKAGEGPRAELPIPYIWFHDNGESGDVDQIAIFVGEYLSKFSPKGFLLMTWADICSKPRLDEFGGGFAVVTAEKTHWFDEHKWAEKLTEGLESRNRNQS